MVVLFTQRFQNTSTGRKDEMNTDRILSKLDEYFQKNDYVGAERHLKYWLDEAKSLDDQRSVLLICNELIGLSRKTIQETKTFEYTEQALNILKHLDIESSTAAATTYINIGTAYKAFGKPEASLPFFEKAKVIYERELEASDSRLGGLYNNMALTFSDLKRFDEAYSMYARALDIMKYAERGELEQAITHLNIASTLETEKGALDADEEINEQLIIAQGLLDTYATATDGYYAFVCEKCASVFGYYGYFLYENELKERVKSIYEGS